MLVALGHPLAAIFPVFEYFSFGKFFDSPEDFEDRSSYEVEMHPKYPLFHSYKTRTDRVRGIQYVDLGASDKTGSKAEKNSSPTLFPFLNRTSITLLDENGKPIKGFFTSPPQGRSAADTEKKMSEIKYVLYTRKSPTGVSVKSAEELRNTSFDPKREVKFITHGWLSSGSADTCITIKDGYLNNSKVNIIIMDWSHIAHDYFYLTPMSSVPKVAHHYAILINDMINHLAVDPRRIHLIGHSLGAQVSGLVWKDMEGKKPGRVTGLDPAFPGFDHIVMFNGRISNESADFVDVIHSCGGLLGILDPVGHADFYPNGGTAAQPGCSKIFEACSHGRSWQFFADSVLYPDRKFYATKCDNWHEFITNRCSHNEKVIMGEAVPPTARGKYFLRTNPNRPFSIQENTYIDNHHN